MLTYLLLFRFKASRNARKRRFISQNIYYFHLVVASSGLIEGSPPVLPLDLTSPEFDFFAYCEMFRHFSRIFLHSVGVGTAYPKLLTFKVISSQRFCFLAFVITLECFPLITSTSFSTNLVITKHSDAETFCFLFLFGVTSGSDILHSHLPSQWVVNGMMSKIIFFHTI